MLFSGCRSFSTSALPAWEPLNAKDIRVSSSDAARGRAADKDTGAETEPRAVVFVVLVIFFFRVIGVAAAGAAVVFDTLERDRDAGCQWADGAGCQWRWFNAALLVHLAMLTRRVG